MSDAAVIEEITRREGQGSLLLWFGALGGPAAWAIQLGLNYSFEEWFACSPATSDAGLVLGYRVPLVALTVTGALALIAFLSGVVSVGCYRRITRADTGSDGRARWMAVAGIMNSVLYFVIIVASFAPPLILRVCATSP